MWRSQPMLESVWPMKKWAYYDELKERLGGPGTDVERFAAKTFASRTPGRRAKTIAAWLAGDSLPMHFALGTGTRCVSLFTCTSPWEIYDYGIQTKIVSPLLEEFFYKRDYDERATTAISVDEVLSAVMAQLDAAAPAASRITSK